MKTPMEYVVEKCIGIGIFILWVLLIVVIIWKKLKKVNENNDDFLKLFEAGKKLKKSRYYDEALRALWKALRKANGFIEFRDAYNEIGACYYEKTDYERALLMFNISLDLKIANLSALKWRSICLAKLGMYEQAYEDASLYDVVIDGSHPVINEQPCFDFETTDSSNLFTSEVLRLFFKENQTCVSNLRYFRFYSSFNKIIPQDVEDHSDLAWILKSKSYYKLFEFFFGEQCLKNKQKFIEKYGTESLFSYDLIFCTVQYLRGNFEDCVKILENPKTELEMVFVEYVKLYLDRFKYINDPTTLVKKFGKKENATIRFWIAKFCYKRHHFHEHFDILQSIKRGNPYVYAELLREYNNYDDARFKKLENEALKKFSHDENILLECCMRYVHLKDGDNLLRILNMMDKESAAFMFYTGLYYSILGDQIRKIYAFKKTIEIDPTFHEAYLQLGINYGEKDPVSGLQYLRDSLKIVSCHDEARSTFKEIIRLENILTVNRKKQQYGK